MDTVNSLIRKHLLHGLGFIPNVEEILEYEPWERYTRKMLDRLIQGHFRYGPIKVKDLDCVKEIKNRLILYETTGNLEFLVDVGNFALVEFETSQHPNRHFKPL